MAQTREIALGVTLAQKDRQVGAQLRELSVFAIRAGAQRAADMMNDLLGGVFNHCTDASGEQFGVFERGGIYRQGAGTQHRGSALQGTVDCAQMGQGMGSIALRTMLAQPLGNAAGRAIPAGGNADPALPESGRCR